MEFDKSVKDLFRLEVPETKLTHARGVNHIATVREVIETWGSGGVLAQARDVRHIVGQDLLLKAEQVVKQARFTYAGLPRKDADAVGQRIF